MGAADSVIRYRLGFIHRWAPAAIGPVALALWSYVIGRDGVWRLLPLALVLSIALALVLSIALALVTLSATVPRAVTVEPDALVVGVGPRAVRLDWADISHVEQRADAVWIMARSGWYLLPLPGGAAPTAPGDRRPLAEAVWTTWTLRRGADWSPPGLDPWTPTTDARGRTTLRAPLASRQWCLGVIGGALGVTMVPNRPAGTLEPALIGSGVLIATVVAVAALHHWWSRVIIDDTGLVIRSVGRIHRVEWWQVDGFRETLGFAGRWHHLTLDYVEISEPGEIRLTF